MQESAMRRVFIIATMFLGVTTAQAQTAQGQPVSGQNSQPALNGQTGSSQPAVGSDRLAVPTSTLSSPSGSSPTASGSSTTPSSGTSGGTGATGSASSSQSPLLLPGEIPDTSTQAASTTAGAPAASSTI